MNTPIRSRLALVALVAAGLASLATGSAVGRSITGYTNGPLVLSGPNDVVVRHVTVHVNPGDRTPTVSARVEIDTPFPMALDAIELTVVRDADGAVLAHGPAVPADPTNGGLAWHFAPFAACRAGHACDGTYTLTMRWGALAQRVSTGWWFYVTADWGTTTPDQAGVRVTIVGPAASP